MAGYSPTFGILGTVIGLIGVLGQLSSPGKLGPDIASAQALRGDIDGAKTTVEKIGREDIAYTCIGDGTIDTQLWLFAGHGKLT